MGMRHAYGRENGQKWHPDARSAETGSGNMAETTEINRAYATSYSRSVVTMALSRTVFEIFDFKNTMTLKSGLGAGQGH